MRVYGIGSDIINIERVRNNLKNKNFKKKLFSISEINTVEKKFNKISSYAKKFAAKEAFVKALGTGFRGIYPSDISIEKDDLGKPSIRSSKTEATKNHLSITNTDSYTLSFVVIEK